MNDTLRTRTRGRTIAGTMLALLASLAMVATTGCDLLSDILGTMTLKGQVVDAQGNPVPEADIKVYLFTDNIDYFAVPGKGNSTNPAKFKARVDLSNLTRRGKVAKTIRTDAQGRYTLAGVPINGVIAVASKDGWSMDIQGMDPTDGTVSLSSALRPKNIDENTVGTDVEPVVLADFVIVGPPAQDDGPGPEPQPPEDEEEIQPPAASSWESFTVEDIDGNVLADLTDGNANLELASLLESGGVVLIKGTHSDTSLKKAFMRVQMGSSTCDDTGLQAKADMVQIPLKDGKITSDAGDFQKWFLTGGYEQIQLDLDQVADSGNESYVVTVDERCAVPASPLMVTLSWDTDRVDADMHLWDTASEEHTYYGSRYEGEARASSYGSIDLDDRDGYGPEVFTLNPTTSGEYAIRVHFFAGQANPGTTVKVRVVRYADGKWHDDTFTSALPYRDWVDLGRFKVDAL